MFLTIVIIVSLLLTYSDSKGYNNYGMKWAFVLLAAVEGLRYGVGSDYFAYMDMYGFIVSHPFSFDAIINYEVWKEPGWALLCYAFKPLGGFFSLVAFVAIIENIVYYNIIKKYVARNWWVFAVFLYTFTQSLYLMNMSMIRQGLAVALFVWAFSFIERRKLAVAALLCFVAWSVHKSAIVLAPFVLMGFIPMFYQKSKTLALVVAVSIALVFVGGSVYSSATTVISDFEVAEEYIDIYGSATSKGNFGYGYLFYLIPTIVSAFYLAKAKASSTERMLVLLPCIVVIIDPFSRFLPLVGRIGIYFEAFRCAAYPLIFKWLSNMQISNICLFSYIFIMIYDYWLFITVSVYAPRLATYQTIFSVLF